MLSSVEPPVVDVDGSSVVELLRGVVLSDGATGDGVVLGLGDAVLGELIVPVPGDVVVLESVLGVVAPVLGVVALGLVVGEAVLGFEVVAGPGEDVAAEPLSVDVDCAYT